MQWLLRLFFGGTIAFAVPVQQLFETSIVGNSMVYFVAIIGKFATAIWAPGFPNRFYDAMKLGSAMSAWGEFAFILATMSHSAHVIDDDQFASVILAILLSVIIGPILLAYAIQKSNDDKRSTVMSIAQSLDDLEVDPEYQTRKYFKIIMKSQVQWGFLWKAENCFALLDLEVVDRRIDYAGGKEDSTTTLTFIVMDDSVDLNRDGLVSKDELESRKREISMKAYHVCADPNAKVSVATWIPRRVLSLSKRATIVHKKAPIELSNLSDDEKQKIYLHSHFPRDAKVLESDTLETMAKKLSAYIQCLVVVKEDETVLGIITKTCLVRGLITHNMDISHMLITDMMINIKDVILMSSHASATQILEKMKKHNCKHMPLVDELTGDILKIADLTDVVISGSGGDTPLLRRQSSLEYPMTANMPNLGNFMSLNRQTSLGAKEDGNEFDEFRNGYDFAGGFTGGMSLKELAQTIQV